MKKMKKLYLCMIVLFVMLVSNSNAGRYSLADQEEIVLSSYDPSPVGGPPSACWLQIMHPSEGSADSACGQTFQFYSGGNYRVTKAMFYMSKYGNPNGTGYVHLYEVSGGIPIGEPLATSEPIDLTTISSDSTWHNYAFNESQQYKVHAGIKYAIVFVNPTVNSNVGGSHYPRVSFDPSYATHEGEQIYYDRGAWHERDPTGYIDCLFYIYGKRGGSAGGQDPQPPWLKVRWDAFYEHLKQLRSPFGQMGATLNNKLQIVVPAMGMLAVFMLCLCGVWILFSKEKPKGQQ